MSTKTANDIASATSASSVMLALSGVEMPGDIERALRDRLERAFRAERALAQLLAQAAQISDALK